MANALGFVFPERCLASLQEVAKSNENFVDNKSMGARKGQPERIAIKMLGTCVTVLFGDRLEMPSSSYPISTSKGELKLA